VILCLNLKKAKTLRVSGKLLREQTFEDLERVVIFSSFVPSNPINLT
jgi:hypothetical protein